MDNQKTRAHQSHSYMGKMKQEPEEGESHQDEQSSSTTERPKRYRNVPSYYGTFIMIFMISDVNETENPEVVCISSDDN